MGVVWGNTRMRQWELVALCQLSELNKNTTVAIEQNVPPRLRVAAWVTFLQRKRSFGAVVTRAAALTRHNMWNSIHTDMLVVVE